MDILKFSLGAPYHSTTVASITGKRHDNVLRDIEMLCVNLTINPAMFVWPYNMTNNLGHNVQQPGYMLPPEILFTLISGYNARDRKHVVVDWVTKEHALYQQFSVANAELLAQNLGWRMQFHNPNLNKDNVFINIADVLLSTTKYAKPMTSLEIEQELAGLYFNGQLKLHKNILRDIDKQFKALGEDPTPFLSTSSYRPYPNSNERDRRIYCLDMIHTLVLMTGYMSNERYSMICRWLAISDPTNQIIQAIEHNVVQAGYEIEMVW